MTVDHAVAWLQTTWLSQTIVSATWIWPACETVHFFGLALTLGVVGVFDLRLLGCFARIPVDAIRELMPFAIAGFALNAVSGLVFLIGHPEQYVHNLAWWCKVGCLGLAGANAALFELTFASRLAGPGASAELPLAARCMGAVSLAAWLGVLFWGRMLPFIGNAF